MPGVKGKSGPRKPPRSQKKLTKAQKLVKKLTQLESERKRKQIARKNGDSEDVPARCLEMSQFGMKHTAQKKPWYYGEKSGNPIFPPLFRVRVKVTSFAKNVNPTVG